jgi:hypothetical protein
MSFDIRQLALDTLYHRNKSDSESCFITNEAGQELEQFGSEAIPVLEDIFRNIIVPAMAEYRKKHGIPDPDSVFREGPPFRGLGGFIGAYWILCARKNASCAVRFFREMPVEVGWEAIHQLPLYFNPKLRLSNVEIPLEYVEYLHELRGADRDELKPVASRALAKLSRIEPATN